MMKAFLGTGLLGSNFVKAMTEKGDQVQVWNRTAAKAKALEADGAKAFDTPAEAVKGADRIHLALKDDQSVEEVLTQARPGLKDGAVLIDHTTTSPDGAVARTKVWKEWGYAYQHAPVFMGPQNARESSGSMLVSGDQDLIARLQPELSKMTGKVINFGAEAGKAAGMKLLGNLFLMAMTGGVVDMLALAKALNIAADELSALLAIWNPAAATQARIKKITGRNYNDPSWELQMARKDAALMMNAAEAGNTDLFVIPAIAAEMDRWIAKGHGDDDWTVIGKDAAS